MITKHFAIYDSKAEFYTEPYPFKTTAEAIRAFTNTANDSKTPMAQNAEDYTLFELGEYDNIKGSFKALNTPKSLGKLIEYKTQQ